MALTNAEAQTIANAILDQPLPAGGTVRQALDVVLDLRDVNLNGAVRLSDTIHRIGVDSGEVHHHVGWLHARFC